MTSTNLPQFYRYIIPIVEVLKNLGGSGRASEVTDLVIEKLNLLENEILETTSNGRSKVKNQISWARLLLVKIGLLDSSQRGVWSLTEKGINEELTQNFLYDTYAFRKELKRKARKKSSDHIDENEIDNDQINETESNYQTELLNILRELPSTGFERICQRLLRESGFEQVTVTGKSGDGGIDGIGILQVNPFVSFRVIFQCKRYQGTVSAPQVRDFRGAMMGRADKGIILTTGSFTVDAKKEARRDGVPPIELVDSEKLIEMFEMLELGLIPKKTYDIDDKFFDEFRA